MMYDSITLYDYATVLRWHNEWLKLMRCKDLGGAIAAAAENNLPKPPFSMDEVEREIIRRSELEIID